MKNKIVKEKKKNYMTEIKEATIELIKPIFKKYGAITPDKAMLKEEVIAEIEDKRKAKYSFSYLKQLGIIKKYKGKFYLSLAEAAANNGKSVTEVEADTENLTTYESGHCYYCSKDIFHHEGSGTMERAIMRNNAYVLKVTGFASIGSAEIVFPTGDEQGEDTDKNFYLKLTSTILPWQVRFNNIEF